jgi:hypothetical protein
MTVYELEKLATPTPWEYGNGAVWSDCYGEGNSPHEVCCIYEGCEVKIDRNGKLLAHCRNNFIRALDALKGCVEQVGHTIPYSFAPDGMDALIKELETV